MLMLPWSCWLLSGLLCVVPELLHAQALSTFPGLGQPAWSSFENPTGRKGVGGLTNHGAKGHPAEVLKPGERKVLLTVQGAGTIQRIWLTVLKQSPQQLRALRLDIYWDGETQAAVSAPLGDFFGVGLGRTAAFEHLPLLVRDLVALHDGNLYLTFLPTRPELLAAFAAVDLAPRLYGEAPNVPALLEWAHAAFAADGLAGAGIFVSGGALDALERALCTQLKPGDKVAVEDPGYFTVLALVRSLGLRPVALASDADGIQPASLAAALVGGCRAVVFSTRA